MTAREIMSPGRLTGGARPADSVAADMPVIEVLPRLLDAPGRELAVSDGATTLGIIDSVSMLEGMGRMIAPRDDCSVITVECTPADYSASQLARAVEDSDAHLVDLVTTPGPEGKLTVTLRVRQSDPSSAVHNLERYDFHVVEAHGAASAREVEIAFDRLLSLKALLNV